MLPDWEWVDSSSTTSGSSYNTDPATAAAAGHSCRTWLGVVAVRQQPHHLQTWRLWRTTTRPMRRNFSGRSSFFHERVDGTMQKCRVRKRGQAMSRKTQWKSDLCSKQRKEKNFDQKYSLLRNALLLVNRTFTHCTLALSSLQCSRETNCTRILLYIQFYHWIFKMHLS